MSNQQAAAEAAAHDHTGRIGASRAPAILGLDPYTTPYEAWLEIIGLVEDDDGERHEAAHWGTVLEDIVVRQGYEPRTETKTQRVNRTLRHPDHDFITCHLDRRVIPVSTRKTVQVKCRDRFVRPKWGAPGTDEVPDKEAAQVMVEIEVANATLPGGVPSEDVAVLFGGNSFEVYTLNRDETKGPQIIDALAHWWEVHVVGDKAPDPTTMSDCRRRWNRGSGDHKEMTEGHKDLLVRFLEAEAIGKEADADKEDVRLELLKAIGEDECLVADGKPIVSWKMVSAFDVDGFIAAEPTIAVSCSKLDTTKLRKEHPKLHATYKTQSRRGNLTVNRSAARKLLNH